MKFGGFIAGALIGMAVVYSLLLDPFEKTAFQIFKMGLENGEKVFSAKEVVGSSTFWKLLAGLGVGGFMGAAVGGALGRLGDGAR